MSLFDNSATSFEIPGMTPVSTHDLGIVGLSGAINHAGDRAYFLDLQGGVTAFSFDQATGVLDATPLFQVPVASPVGPFGIDQVAVHPSGATLYVPAPEGLRILDAQTGATTGSITGGSLGTTAGICFGAGDAKSPPGRPVRGPHRARRRHLPRRRQHRRRLVRSRQRRHLPVHPDPERPV